jgi:hypothetical protein
MKKGFSTPDVPKFTWVKDAPLRQWFSVGAFDTARECMAERARRIEKSYQDYLESVTKKWGEDFTVLNKVQVEISEASECVASDDRRLAQ